MGVKKPPTSGETIKIAEVKEYQEKQMKALNDINYLISQLQKEDLEESRNGVIEVDVNDLVFVGNIREDVITKILDEHGAESKQFMIKAIAPAREPDYVYIKYIDENNEEHTIEVDSSKILELAKDIEARTKRKGVDQKTLKNIVTLIHFYISDNDLITEMPDEIEESAEYLEDPLHPLVLEDVNEFLMEEFFNLFEPETYGEESEDIFREKLNSLLEHDNVSGLLNIIQDKFLVLGKNKPEEWKNELKNDIEALQPKSKGKGWFGESERHSKARKEGKADFLVEDSMDALVQWVLAKKLTSDPKEAEEIAFAISNSNKKSKNKEKVESQKSTIQEVGESYSKSQEKEWSSTWSEIGEAFTKQRLERKKERHDTTNDIDEDELRKKFIHGLKINEIPDDYEASNGIFYHGSNISPDEILNEGLEARKEDKDYGAALGQRTGVFLTTDKIQAREFGKYVYEIELPQTEIVFKDELVDNAWFYPKDIVSEYISIEEETEDPYEEENKEEQESIEEEERYYEEELKRERQGQGKGWFGESERHSKARKTGKADLITDYNLTYIGTVPTNSITYDFIEMSSFKPLKQDFQISEDFTILEGSIARDGAYDYVDSKGNTFTLYKDWDNLKEVYPKINYLPIKGSVDIGAHKSVELDGFAYNFKPNEQTHEIQFQTILLNDLNEITPLLNPNEGYYVSPGYEDDVIGNKQFVKRVDHVAIALANKEKARACSGFNQFGKSCTSVKPIQNYDQNLNSKEVVS